MLVPARSRTAASGRLVIATARSVAANGPESSTRGCAVVAVAGTTWSSNSPIPVTRKASGTASFRFAVPEESFRIPISRSVSPGRSRRRLANAWSMTAVPATEEPNIRPAVTFTRSPGDPERPVRASEHLHAGIRRRSAGTRQRHVVLRGEGHRRHLGMPAKRGEVLPPHRFGRAAASGEVLVGGLPRRGRDRRLAVGHDDGHLRGVRPREQPRVGGGRCAPCPGRRRDNDRTGEPEDQREPEHRPPPVHARPLAASARQSS